MENINLIKKIADSFSVTTKEEFDDLFQEGALAYLEALKTYDPTKGQLTTYMWYCIHNRLTNYLKEQEKERECIIPLEYFEVISDPDSQEKEYRNILEELYEEQPSYYFENMSKEAQKLADVVLKDSTDFLFLNKKELKEKVRTQMTEQGWSLMTIFKSFRELQTIYS
jgi:RNA polymerase sigma factor (sigma-70 family)